MYARSTTIHADPERIDTGIALVRDELLDLMQDMPGCLGLSMLVDRDSGRCIITSSWESAEAMHETTDRVRDVRRQAADALSGGFDVQEWEIVALHRLHPAATCARVIWSTVRDVGMVERTIDAWRMIVPDALEKAEGFSSVSFMVDRQSGRAVSTVGYRDRAAMAAAANAARAMREEFAGAMDVDVTEVAEFDLVLAHLRVPEMA